MAWAAHKITYRIVKTGRVVTPAYAKAHPETTRKEHWRKYKPLIVVRIENLGEGHDQHASGADRR